MAVDAWTLKLPGSPARTGMIAIPMPGTASDGPALQHHTEFQKRTMLQTFKAAVPERRMRSILIAAVLALSSAFFAGYIYFSSTSAFKINDFFIFWAAGRFVLQGGSLAGVYDTGVFHAFQLGLGAEDEGLLLFVYPPHAALLFMPLAKLPLHWAMLVWDVLTLTVYLTAVWCAVKSQGTAMLAAVVAPTTASNIICGQIGLLTGGLAIMGFVLLRRSPLLAGVLFGLLSIKPQIAALPMLILLLTGNHKALLAALITTLLLVLVSMGVFQADAWSSWVQAMTGFSDKISVSPLNRGYGVTAYLTLLSLGASRPAALAIQGLVALLALSVVVRIMRINRGPFSLMAALTGIFLVTPYAMIYDMSIVSVVCLMLVAEGNRSGFHSGELLVCAAAWCLPLMLIATDGGNPALALCVLAGLFALILRRLAQTPPADLVQEA